MAALLALAAHLVVLAALALEAALHPPERPALPAPVTLQPVDAQEWERRRGPHAPPEPRPPQEPRRGPPAAPPPPPPRMSHEGQLVEMAPGNGEKSPSARFFGETNNHVQRETQARVKTLRPGRPATPPDPPPAPVAVAPPAPPPPAPQPEHQVPKLIPDITPLELGPSAQPATPAASIPKPSPEDKPGEAGGFIDDLSGLAVGDETSLNTRQLQYAHWFNEMKSAVGRNWHPAQVQEATRHILDPVTRVTVVRFTLDRSGAVKDIAVEKPCGFEPYDEEAVRAVRAAGTFPDPPDFLFQGRDSFPFHYTFKVDEYWPKPQRR